jgi:3-dehydroquinate dehydratase-2
VQKAAIMAKRVLVLNGPNLNMLGIREPGTYGSQTLADIEKLCKAEGKKLGLTVTCKQSNREGELVEWIQQALGTVEAIVINPAGYSHTSVAIRDALSAVKLPTVEVHLSNIHAREEFRHHSYVSAVATGVICGLGAAGYRLALSALAEKL